MNGLIQTVKTAASNVTVQKTTAAVVGFVVGRVYLPLKERIIIAIDDMKNAPDYSDPPEIQDAEVVE